MFPKIEPVWENEGNSGASSTAEPATSTSTPAAPAPASPEPAASPGPGTGETASAESVEEFEGLGLEFGDLETPVATAQPTAQPPGTQPTAVPPVPAPAATPPQPAPAAQPTAEPTMPQEPVVDPESIEAVMQAFGEKGSDIIAQLAAGPFALDQATQDALEADALAETPKLLAKTYLQAVATSLKYVQQMVPNMIQRQVAVIRAQNAGEQAFFKRWPQLSKEKHGADIMRVAKTFNSLNPKATREQIISSVGTMVMAMHNLRDVAPSPAPARQQPFVPAQSGAPVMAAPVAPDEWDGLGQDFEI